MADNLDPDGKHLWLIAIDDDNVLHQPQDSSESGVGPVQIRTARFPDIRTKRVKEYRLVSHLADRRFRFKPAWIPAGAAPTDDIVSSAGGEESGTTTISAGCRNHMKLGRIIAIDKRDQECFSKVGGCLSIGNFSLLNAVFPGLPLARVKEFQFQTRAVHHHIEFRNVSLYAGQKQPGQSISTANATLRERRRRFHRRWSIFRQVREPSIERTGSLFERQSTVVCLRRG